MNENLTLHFKEAKWNVSGLFAHDDILLYFYDIFKKRNIDIFFSVHGSTACNWNSGRAIRQHSDEYIDQCIMAYNKRNIPMFLTFSNYYIEEYMLDDEAPNILLEKISFSDKNGVILSSPVLSKYIREKYPMLKIYSSILNVVNQNGQGQKNFYSRASKEFDRVVLHPDDSFNIDFLETLEEKSSFEVIVNENCVRNCPYRKLHEDMVCEFFIKGRDKESFDKMAKFTKKYCCSLLNDDLLDKYITGEYRNCNLDMNELESIYKLGYRYFKLQGRNDSPGAFVYDICKYILGDNIYQDVFKMIMNRISDTPYKQTLISYM